MYHVLNLYPSKQNEYIILQELETTRVLPNTDILHRAQQP